jgi:hypothetical protein
MFKVSPASLQTFIDTPNCVLEDRVQYSTVHIPSVFCDGHLQIISCVGIVRQVHRDFLIALYMPKGLIFKHFCISFPSQSTNSHTCCVQPAIIPIISADKNE